MVLELRRKNPLLGFRVPPQAGGERLWAHEGMWGPANYSCQIKLQRPPVLRLAHTWDVSGELEKTPPGSHSRDRRNGPEGWPGLGSRKSFPGDSHLRLSAAHRQPLSPDMGLRTPPAGPAEVEEASREQEKGSLY